MEIAQLGEFGLIKHLTQDLKPKNESTRTGVGDDCAVMHYPDKEVLVTTDMLMEGIHFDLTYIDLKHLGYKSAMVNISDIFAMNGTPRQMVVSIALGKRFKVEDLEEFYSGLRIACDKWGVDLVGGDTTTSMTGLAISITCIGEADAADIVYRKGASDTDLICVSGNLGAAYMGLQLLEREKPGHPQGTRPFPARLRRQGIPDRAPNHARGKGRHHRPSARDEHPPHGNDGHQRRPEQ